MKRFIFLGGLLLLGVAAWRVGNALSSDAIGLALGVVFGVMASLPGALLVLVAARRQAARDEAAQSRPAHYGGGYPGGYPAFPPQPPVIVVTGAPGMLGNGQYGQNGAQHAQYGAPYPDHWAAGPRRFKVVGEQEEWLEE
jgi:hypothetical protein